MIERTCQFCGKTFLTKPCFVKKGHAKYCSKDCHNQSMKTTNLGKNNHWYKEEVPMTCKHCGKEFFVKPGKTKVRKYCSLECAYASEDRARSGEESNLWRGGTRSPKKKYPKKIYTHNVTCMVCGKHVKYEIRNKRAPVTCGSKACIAQRIKDTRPPKLDVVKMECVVCGKEVEREQWVANRYKHGPICSEECRLFVLNKRASDMKKERITLTCECCGKEFKVKPSEVHLRKHCSKSCNSKMRVGERNGRWMGGVSFEPYCEKFNEDLKERVREFWGRKCAICGRDEVDNIPSGARLSVHHVNYNKDACCNPKSPREFAPICTPCHSKTSGKHSRIYWKKYLHDLIIEKYDGKSYYTKEEYKEVLSSK